MTARMDIPFHYEMQYPGMKFSCQICIKFLPSSIFIFKRFCHCLQKLSSWIRKHERLVEHRGTDILMRNVVIRGTQISWHDTWICFVVKLMGTTWTRSSLSQGTSTVATMMRDVLVLDLFRHRRTQPLLYQPGESCLYCACMLRLVVEAGPT